MSRPRVAKIALVTVLLLGAGCDEGDGPLQRREQAFTYEEVATPGMTVRVRDMNGEIEVVPSRDSVVRASAAISWRRGDPDESLRFTGAKLGDDILICAIWGDGTCTVDKYQSNFNISRGVTDAKVFFRIEVPAGVRLELVVVNGDIAAAASAPVEARTTNGDIRVVTAVGPVRGETTSGDVDLRMASLVGTDSVVARSMNGNLFVYLPDAVDASLDLSTTNGSVSTEFPVTVTGSPNRRRLQAALGAGTRPVRLRTLNGNASIRRLDATGRSATP